MDSMESAIIDDDNQNEEAQQIRDEGAESSVRPTLSQVKKSWGFRRSTIAKREFMEEVGDLSHSPPPPRKGRSRKANQTPRTATEDASTASTARTAKSVLDELQWSAPSSPASEDSKPASEASAGVNLDPAGWQDFGSAFHTAFSLLGGEEGLSMTMSDALGVTEMGTTNANNDSPKSQTMEEPEVSDNMDVMEIAEPDRPDNVAEDENVVLISSQEEEDSDNLTLMQIKEQACVRKESSKARGGKGGKGRARGRGRGKGRARAKGKGRGRAVAIQFSTDEGDNSDEVVVLNSFQLQPSLELETENPHRPPEMSAPTADDIGLIYSQSSGSDCIIIDNDSDKNSNTSPGQYEDAPEEDEEKEMDARKECPSILDTEEYDTDALCCICRHKHNKRFMMCCNSCQAWFHGDCVGIGAVEGEGQEYICHSCTAKNQSQLLQLPESLFPELSLPECLTLSPPGDEEAGPDQREALKESVTEEKEEEVRETPVTGEEPKPEAEMDTDSSVPLCIGPGCSKQALPDSVYCGPECILQHAAVTMKTLSVPKEPKSKRRSQRNTQTAKPSAKAQRSGRTSKRLAAKAEAKRDEEQVEEEEEEEEEQEAAGSPKACDPILTEVQAPSIPSSKLHTASNLDNKSIETDTEAVPPSKPCPVGPSADADLVSQPATEAALPQSDPQEEAAQPANSDAPAQQPAESDPSTPSSSKKADSSPAADPVARRYETGALMVTKTAYVIPKKPSGVQPTSDNPSTSASFQRPCAAAAAQLSETRNLPVSPAPSAPSSRPSQPNNQIRHSIQRSLTGILFKRVCECEDLEMSESEAAKLVANIEMEMFDIFRNTDSKYMNKYRTIMFNLKDPRNKGLLYRVVLGDIGPFRLVRMSQKDMQATKAPEPNVKTTTEVKGAAPKEAILQKPEAVKLNLPTLNPTQPNRKPENTAASQEQKRGVPPPHPPVLKTKARQPSQPKAVPDILACVLKDTTSEHKTHLFDLKCKICTGQMSAVEEEEPVKKKSKVPVSRDKQEFSWKKIAGDDSPLRAPPDSPEMNLPASSLMETSHLVIDSPVLTIIESPASPVMDSPASPTLESPASPVMESPASPTQDALKTAPPNRPYAPVVIPVVSTVTISRRDPRTAANRFPASFGGTSGPPDTALTQAPPYHLHKETPIPQSAATFARPPVKTLPKSILMKPSSTADPRLYGTSSRTSVSQSLAHDETSKFLTKQDIVWKGFLNMLTVAKFVTKGYLVSGSAENLKADLPDTIQIGGRILPQTVWEYVAKLKTSVTKELCVIRFQPATEEEEVAYVSMFSYFSSRGRFGVVSSSSRSIKDMYLFPLSAKEPIPSILQPLEGPGLEPNRPNLLLGLAIVQKTKRPGNLPQEIEEKRPKVHMSKDPTWIPKPPVLYGSDKLEIFQPYDPETPTSSTPPLGSPSCPGSPSDSSSSGSVAIPPVLTSMRKTPVSTSASVTATQSATSTISDKNTTKASGDKTPIHPILKTLFRSNSSDSTASTNAHSTKPTISASKIPVSSEVSKSMMDPIVQQYGQKSKVKKIEEEENEFDRPYDPEEEYDPAMGYGMIPPKTSEKHDKGDAVSSGFMEDDVAYDPEDETIFQEFQSDSSSKKPPIPVQLLDSPSCPKAVSASAPVQTPPPAAVTPNLPTGSVVVSAATLSEQQRMLEELNKQIEEQKRQLKEQEEALRQQREAVGMFMAQFSVSDNFMSPPGKSLPPNQLPLQSDIMPTGSKTSESTDKVSSLSESVDSCNVDSQTVELKDTTADHNIKVDENTTAEQDEAPEIAEDSNKYSSAGEIGDSDVAYDPEDESLFDEIQDDVFKGGTNMDDSSSRLGHGGSHKGTSPHSYHSRKRRSSPKRRSRRERGRHRSPSKMSQQRSPSHSRRRRERDRHRRSERDRSRHRARDHSERQGHHHKSHSARRHSRGQRRSTSSSRRKDSISPLSQQCTEGTDEILLKSEHVGATCDSLDFVAVESQTSSSFPVPIKKDPEELKLESHLVEIPDKNLNLCPNEPSPNIKVEISEPQKHRDISSILPSEVEKSFQQNAQLHDKLETTVPLREIDPPLRDSPESPDPEPQFVKHSCTEKLVSLKNEIEAPVEQASSSGPMVTQEDNNLPFTSCTTAVEDVKLQTSTGKTLDFISLNLQSSCVRGENVLETDKQIAESPVTQHPAINYLRSTPEMRQKSVEVISNSPRKESSLQNAREDTQMMDSSRPDSGGHLSAVYPYHLNTDSSESGKVDVRNQTVSCQQKEWLQREKCINMGGTESTLHCKSGVLHVSSAGKEVSQPNVGAHRIDHVSKFRELHAKHDFRTDMAGRTQRSDQKTDGFGHLNKRGSRWSSPKDIVGTGPNFQGQNMQTENAQRVNEQMAQRVEVEKNVSSAEWRDPRPGIVGPDMRNRSQGEGPHRSNLNWNSREELSMQDEWRFNQTDRNGPHMESQRPAMGFGSKRFGELGHEIRESNMQHLEHRGPGGPTFMEQRPESQRPDNDIPGSEKRGPVTAFTGCEESGQLMDIQKHGSRVIRGLDFVGPELERRGSAGECPGPYMSGPHFRKSGRDRSPLLESQSSDMSGTLTPDVRGQWPKRTGPALINSGPHRHGTRAPSSESNAPTIEGLGHDRGYVMGGPWHENENPEGIECKRPWPESESSCIEGAGPDRRGSGFKNPGSEKRGPMLEAFGPESRGPMGSEFRGSGSENRGLFLEGCRPDRKGPGDLQFRGDNRDFSMNGPGPEHRGPGGPELWGPGPEYRDFTMRGPEPERRGSGGPEFKGSGPMNRDRHMDGPNPDRSGPRCPELGGSEPENRGFFVGGVGPDRRGPGGREFRRSGPENRGSSMENLRHDQRGPGVPEVRGPGPEHRGLSMENPRPDRRGHGGVDFRGQGPENIGLFVEGPGPDGREPEGPDFRGPEPKIRDSSIEMPGLSRRGPVCQEFRGSGPKNRGPSIEGHRPDRKGPRGPDFSDPGFDGRGPVRGSMPENRLPCDPNFRGPEPEWKGPMTEDYRPDRKRPRGPEFREPVIENKGACMGGLMPDRKGPGGPDFSRPRPHSRDPHFGDSRIDRNAFESSSFRAPGDQRIFQHSDPPTESTGPHRNIREGMPPPYMGGFRHDDTDDLGPQPEISDRDVPGFEETYENLRGPRSVGRTLRRPAPEYMRQDLGNETDSSHDNWEGQDNRCLRPMQERFHEQDQEHRWHGGRGPAHLQGRPDMQDPSSVMGREDGWNDPNFGVPDPYQNDPHMVPSMAKREQYYNQWEEPDQSISGPFFREERFPDSRGQINDRGQGRDIREDFQDNSDMGNNWGQPVFRGSVRAPNREEHRPHGRGPDRRQFDIEGPDRSDTGDTNFRPRGERFEQNLRMQRRGPRMRRLGSDRTEMRGPSTNSSDLSHGQCHNNADHELLDSGGCSDMIEPGFESWESESDIPMSDRVGPGNREPRQRDPYQIARHQEPGKPHSALPNRCLGPGPNPGSNTFPVKPRKHRGALLPTPNEARLRFPNRMIQK